MKPIHRIFGKGFFIEMSKIRIFMVGLSNNKGGVESYIINLCEHLHSKEFEVVYDWPEMCIEDKNGLSLRIDIIT